MPILSATSAPALNPLTAAHESAVVAAADSTAMRVGRQPHRNLIKAHIEAAKQFPRRADPGPETYRLLSCVPVVTAQLLLVA